MKTLTYIVGNLEKLQKSMKNTKFAYTHTHPSPKIYINPEKSIMSVYVLPCGIFRGFNGRHTSGRAGRVVDPKGSFFRSYLSLPQAGSLGRPGSKEKDSETP